MGRAVGNGATVVQELEDKIYGDRSGTFEDAWGYRRTFMTHIEDVSPDEMGKPVAELMKAA